MQLFLDIETIGTEDQKIIAEISDSILPPGNISKAETIVLWEKEKKAPAVADAIAKTSFDGALGKCICIGYAFNDDPVQTIVGEEPDILNKFAAEVSAMARPSQIISIVGHNVQFDINFLWKRFVVNAIKPCWQIKWKGKPWDHECTMRLWDDDPSKRISLDKLCKVLGVQTSKGEIDGKSVWQAYKDGKLEEIAKYCAEDVRACRECYKRMMFQ